MTKWTFNKWQKVKIVCNTDIHDGMVGVIVHRSIKQTWPYTVCFGQDTHGNLISGIYQKREIQKIA